MTKRAGDSQLPRPALRNLFAGVGNVIVHTENGKPRAVAIEQYYHPRGCPWLRSRWRLVDFYIEEATCKK